MSILNSLKPLDQYAAEIRRSTIVDAREYIKRARERVKENIEKARLNREAIGKLETAGIEVSDFHTTYAYVTLGYFPQTKSGNANLAEAVRKVRLALGSPLKMHDKDVGNTKTKTVVFTLVAEKYPMIRVRFERKLPKGAKCRIVTQRSTYKTLVCDL